MTQPVNFYTPQPHSHSPWLFSPFSIDCHSDYLLLNQILYDGLLLQQPWYDDSLPYMCQAVCHEAVDQKAQEQLTAAAMAKLPYTSTSANNNNDTEENNICTYQDDGGALANLPSPSGGCAGGMQMHQ